MATQYLSTGRTARGLPPAGSAGALAAAASGLQPPGRIQTLRDPICAYKHCQGTSEPGGCPQPLWRPRCQGRQQRDKGTLHDCNLSPERCQRRLHCCPRRVALLN